MAGRSIPDKSGSRCLIDRSRESPCIQLALIHPDDRLGWTVALAGAALHTQADIDVGLCIPFCDGIALTSGGTGAAQNAKICYLVRHGILLKDF
jgi:hypothetical protein